MSGYCVQRWSLSLGRWCGVPVYLHMFLLLFVVLTLAFTPQMTHGAVVVGVLLSSLLLHELAHAWAAIRVGGKIDAIVVGPVGGLVSPRVPDEPEVHLFVALAGPIVHLMLAVLAAIVLAANGDTQLITLLNPVGDLGWMSGPLWLVAAKLTLWLNWILMLLNLLPTYPFDGGPVLRAMLWPALGRRTARIVSGRVAMSIAIGFCVLAILTVRNEEITPLPVWIPLVLLGIFVFFSARQDLLSVEASEQAEEPAGYHAGSAGLDLLDAMWSDDDEEGVLVEHQQHQPADRNRSDQEEAYEDAKVDDILARLNHSSLSELSPEERDVLQRASERYKQRRRPSSNA